MAHPHNHHQSSLEGVIQFSNDTRFHARARFHEIIQHYENAGIPPKGQYDRPKLLRFTYEFSCTEQSKDDFLRAFFNAVSLSIDEKASVDFSHEQFAKDLRSDLIKFADLLVQNFFLPMKASTSRIRDPSPTYYEAIQQNQHDRETFTGTSSRLASLQIECLRRDRNRCVISHRLDRDEYYKREAESQGWPQDDDGNPLDGRYGELEVAHILPHSLIKSRGNKALDDPKQAALQILNMFDTDVVHLIDGTEIDRPCNAITLERELHRRFDNYEIYFEPVDGTPNTYKIDTFLAYSGLNEIIRLPVIRCLSTAPTIDPPLPRLLAVHRAIAHILHLSAAGGYIDKILQDKEEPIIQVNGTTSLGQLVKLRIDGWWDGRVERW